MGRYNDEDDSQPQQPFNDATDYLNRHVGAPINKANLRKLPKGIRYIGYFFLVCIGILIVGLIIGIWLNK